LVASGQQNDRGQTSQHSEHEQAPPTSCSSVGGYMAFAQVGCVAHDCSPMSYISAESGMRFAVRNGCRRGGQARFVPPKLTGQFRYKYCKHPWFVKRPACHSWTARILSWPCVEGDFD